MALTRKELLEGAGLAALGIVLVRDVRLPAAVKAVGSLVPLHIEKYQVPLTIPPAMPRTDKINVRGGKNIEYYEIAVRQFEQQILPPGMPKTTVWSYGSLTAPGTVAQGGSFNYPALTIEAKWEKPVRVRWVNDLKDGSGKPLPHLLPVDPTLHWANPPGGTDGRDSRPSFDETPGPYTGPVPIVTHVHGAHVPDYSDGYTEAWFLPKDAATGPYAGYAEVGTWYETFRETFEAEFTDAWSRWDPGTAVAQYPNDQDAATLWYHDHTLGMTRLNVYAGPAGFYLLRGGPRDAVVGTLPGPAPALGDPPGTRYYEIPIVIQDRSFNADGSLFYPDTRAFFEGLEKEQLQIPFIGEEACDGEMSDVAPIWNPEFFGETMVVNGATWPYLEVEQRRYRFRFLNGCNSRFLILELEGGVPFWQIGADGGFLPAPAPLARLLMAPAERADVIVDFSNVPVGTDVRLTNLGPDEPFGGGVPDVDFDPADPDTTGQVMQFRVVRRVGADRSTPPSQLALPALPPLPPVDHTRQVSLNEEESKWVRVVKDEGNVVLDCVNGEPFGPTAALLGKIGDGGVPKPLMWDDEVTEKPRLGTTELWEIVNFTVDAHPIHIHEVQFEVVNRENRVTDEVRPPEPWETGVKDTVIAYPGEITRVKALFDIPGQFVWHCHVVEHEDNEMMRPLRVLREGEW